MTKRLSTYAKKLYHSKLARAGVVALIVAALIPGRAYSQLGLDPCCAIISAGLNAISSLLKNAVAAPLGSIQQIQQQTASFEQQVIYPLAAINQAKALAVQFQNEFVQMRQVSQLNIQSATLPTPQGLEQKLLSRNLGAIPQISVNYGAVYGKVMPSTDAPPEVRDLGILRLRTATGRLDWATTSLVAGQDSLFFLPQSPTSLASLETPALAYAGNLWAWLPQVRVEHRFPAPNGSEIAIQAGILDPISGETLAETKNRQSDSGEQSDQPAFAAHISWSRPLRGRTLSIGAAGYSSKQLLQRTHIRSWLAAIDWQVPVSSWMSFTGSIYRGSAIGGLGGGLGRSVIPKLGDASTLDVAVPQALDAVGGWTQMKLTLSPRYELNMAFGEDNPFASELNTTTEAPSYLEASLARNWAAFANLIYHARSNLLFAIEYRRIRSQELKAEAESANHINVSMGVRF